MRQNTTYQCLTKLLECYGYFKIYSSWGTKSVGELKTKQPEVFEHLSEIWTSLLDYDDVAKHGRAWKSDLAGLKVKDGIRLTLDALTSLAKRPEGSSVDDKILFEAMAKQALLTEELLLPKPHFLESLTEENGDSQGSNVPNALFAIWSDVLTLLADGSSSFVPDLLCGLFDTARSSQDGSEREVAAEWIKVFSRAAEPEEVRPQQVLAKTGKQARKRKREDHGRVNGVASAASCPLNRDLLASTCNNRFVDYCLNFPSDLLLNLLPHISNLHSPPIPEDKLKRLEEAIKVFLCKHDVISDDENEATRRADDDDDCVWSLVDEGEVLSALQSRDLSTNHLDLLMIDATCDEADAEKESDEEEEDLIFDFAAAKSFFRWEWPDEDPTSTQPASAVAVAAHSDHGEVTPVPAFYQNPAETKSNINGPRERRGNGKKRRRKK